MLKHHLVRLGGTLLHDISSGDDNLALLVRFVDDGGGRRGKFAHLATGAEDGARWLLLILGLVTEIVTWLLAHL